MKKAVWVSGAIALAAAAAIGIGGSRLIADEDGGDFGLRVQRELNDRAAKLLGADSLSRSALGPYTAADSTQALFVARGLRVSLVSSAVHFSTDQIGLWPDDRHPTHLFVCDESSSNPAVQRVDLSLPPASNASTILTGIVACDPIRRTPWGSLTVAEESTEGGTYEIMNPLSITSPIAVTNRAAGITTDARVVKRKALGQLAFEGNPVLPDGTIVFGDELRPGGGNPGGGIRGARRCLCRHQRPPSSAADRSAGRSGRHRTSRLDCFAPRSRRTDLIYTSQPRRLVRRRRLSADYRQPVREQLRLAVDQRQRLGHRHPVLHLFDRRRGRRAQRVRQHLLG